MVEWINSTVELDDYNIPCEFCLNTPISVRFNESPGHKRMETKTLLESLKW